MKKLLRRICAYTIDMLVVLLITQCISGIPAINGELTNYNKYYNMYIDSYEEYAGFRLDLLSYYEDDELSSDEYEELITDYEDYESYFEDYYADEVLDEDEYESIVDKIDSDYEEEYIEIYYKISKYSVFYMTTYVIVVILYFVIFNKITEGQTLGKKMFRLAIVNRSDENKSVPIWSYLLRMCFLYQPISYLARIIGVYFLNADNYYTLVTIFYDINYYLELIIIFMIIIRQDGLGPHELLSKTRVVLYDKDGKEIENKPFFSKKEGAEEKNLNS